LPDVEPLRFAQRPAISDFHSDTSCGIAKAIASTVQASKKVPMPTMIAMSINLEAVNLGARAKDAPVCWRCAMRHDPQQAST
jgi:hypothetical protein